MKKFAISSNWNRYRKIDVIMLDKFSTIKTERQLAYYIYRRFGDGRYMVLAYKKGVEGFWRFWLGFIQQNGFIRDISKDREIQQLEREYQKAQTDEEKDLVQEDITFTKEINKEVGQVKRRGPIGLIKSRPGVLHEFEEY